MIIDRCGEKKMSYWKSRVPLRLIAISGVFILLFSMSLYAEPMVLPNINIGIGQTDDPSEVTSSLQMIFLLTILSLAPSILVMMTAFTRIMIALSFIRSAMGTQQMPPNQVLIGLALFLTLFIMAPTFETVNNEAIKPYAAAEISQEVAMKKGMYPIKDFMLRQTRDVDLKLFADIAKMEPIEEDKDMIDEIPATVLIPAFIISEIRAGFMIGFLIYIPFIVIDMVVASTLMAMGMMMLPPVMISLPFKILLFILVDGWNLVIGQLIQTFK